MRDETNPGDEISPRDETNPRDEISPRDETNPRDEISPRDETNPGDEDIPQWGWFSRHDFFLERHPKCSSFSEEPSLRQKESFSPLDIFR